MRSNKKLARALAGVMIGSQVLATVPMTNVVPVFASEVIALLDVLAQFAGHKCSLPGHGFAELDLFGQIDDKAI